MSSTLSGARPPAEPSSAEQETQYMFPPPVVVAPGSIGRADTPLPTSVST